MSKSTEAAPSNHDPRLDYLGSYVTKSLRLKPEKWTRVLAIEEYRNTLKDFMDKPTVLTLIVVLTPSAQLIPHNSFPIVLKTKGVYFVKKNVGVVPKEGCNEMIISGDLAPKTIDQLAALVDEIFVPLLSNPLNHTKWPAIVAQDIKKHVHSLKSTVYQVKGKVNGQTVLPMPVGVEKVHDAERDLVEGGEADLYLKSAIEGVVIKWATQINDVMLEDSAHAFNNGANPTPQAELEFWRSRLSNLTYIYDQLRSERVRCMAVILEMTDSAYFPCFRNLFRNIVGALKEARDIDMHLKGIERHFQGLEDTDFSELLPLFRPMFHVLCLIWGESKYYCHSSKLMVLLKELCNLLIHQGKRFLDSTTLFHSDIDEAKQRIIVTSNVLKKFRATFDHYKENLAPYFKDREPVFWTFHPNAVFDRMNKFLDRLNTIQWFFNTVLEFTKLEKIEIGGLKGRILSSRITGVSQEFSSLFAAFASKTYDVLDPDDDTFDEDFNKFQEAIVQLDTKLATILCESFDNCANLECIFKGFIAKGQALT